MTRTQDTSHDETQTTALRRDRHSPNAESNLGFLQDGRAQAEQLDFLNAMILLLAFVGLFFAFSGIILDVSGSAGPADDYSAIRGTERIAGDLLKADINNTHLAEGCADDFFALQANASCNIEDFDGGTGSELEYLRQSVGLSDEYNANVSIYRPNGAIAASRSYRMGPNPPSSETITQYYRYVSFGDIDGDGTADYYRLKFRIWER